MTVLNKNLLKKQNINPETEAGLQATHAMLELILDNPELVGIDSASEVVRGLEFALQKLWNFPQNENFHRYQFMIKGCVCPMLDNEDMFQFGLPYRYYNMECPVHSAKTKKSEESKPAETPKETGLSGIYEEIGELVRIKEEMRKLS